MDNEWTFNVKGLGLVRVCAELLYKLLQFRQIESDAPESGGVLVGSHLNSRGALLINKFTPPQTSDRQSRCNYYRSKAHDKLAKSIWRESEHRSTYVGLWHTHPEPIPNFSATDKTDWINAIKHSSYEGYHVFFFIVGQTHIRCWVGTNKRFKVKIKLVGEYNV